MRQVQGFQVGWGPADVEFDAEPGSKGDDDGRPPEDLAGEEEDGAADPERSSKLLGEFYEEVFAGRGGG